MRRGSLVFARCHQGSEAALAFWAEVENMVLLSDSNQFERLVSGLSALSPVGFLKQDVFKYDEGLAKDLSRGIDWSLLEPFDAL